MNQPTSGPGNNNADPLIGQTLANNYLILGTLGEGGMALVYTGLQLSSERQIAIKTLKSRESEVMARFTREMQTHAKLKHKNIVEAIDCFQIQNGQAFLVMEFVEGQSLESVISKGRIQNEVDAAEILSQVLDALAHAHDHKIVHRDLKPANIILVSNSDTLLVKVLDFGIAKMQDDLQKLTAAGKALGSPLYMSPEQCMGLDLTVRSDLYSIGILAYELVSGRVPYNFSSIVKVMGAHCDPTVFPQKIAEVCPEVRAASLFDEIIMRAVHSDVDQRFQSAAEFRSAIDFWRRCVVTGKELPLPRELAVPLTSTEISKPKESRAKDHTREVQELMQSVRSESAKNAESTTASMNRAAVCESDQWSNKRRKEIDPNSFVRSFLIGMTALCLTLLAVAAMMLNFDSLVLGFKNISRQFTTAIPGTETRQSPVKNTEPGSIVKTEPPIPNTSEPATLDSPEEKEADKQIGIDSVGTPDSKPATVPNAQPRSDYFSQPEANEGRRL